MLMPISLTLPLLLVKRTYTSRLEPSFNAVEVECVLTNPPGDRAVGRGAALVRLALDAQLHEKVAADRARVDLNIPAPHGNGIPFFEFYPFLSRIGKLTSFFVPSFRSLGSLVEGTFPLDKGVAMSCHSGLSRLGALYIFLGLIFISRVGYPYLFPILSAVIDNTKTGEHNDSGVRKEKEGKMDDIQNDREAKEAIQNLYDARNVAGIIQYLFEAVKRMQQHRVDTKICERNWSLAHSTPPLMD
eukprot:1387309-Amorphochlora_amoeboformis.AAC.1